MRTINRVIYLTLALVVLEPTGLLRQVQAVSPTPDGRSPFSNTAGNVNTGVGGGALALNNTDSNTADSHNFNNSKFHGWWRNTMIGAMHGFNAGGPNSFKGFDLLAAKANGGGGATSYAVYTKD